MEDGLRHSVFLPDHGLRHRRSNSTRRRGGIGGKEMVHCTEQLHHHTENTIRGSHHIESNDYYQHHTKLRTDLSDTSHTATCTARRHRGTPFMRRTRWRHVRLLMVSWSSRASTDPGNINENRELLEKVDRYHNLLSDVAKTMFEIHKEFISTTAPKQINIADNLLVKVNKDLKAALATTLPKLESVFVDPQNDIERLVSLDIYPQFVRHQMAMSAARAFGGNRRKYSGLGDCFVLTDPSKADNPITFASDGFVTVTGYPRNEIIPRNCRFLQTRYTNKSAVKRPRMAIDKREESVELLLNQKKNSEPFWNLLYVTPLFDARGNVVFFLGGQIDNHSQSVRYPEDACYVG